MKTSLMTKTIVALCGFGVSVCMSAYAASDSTGHAGAADNNNTTMAPSEPATSNTQMTDDAFLAANKTKPGVVTLPDGLQYKILTPGSGKHPSDTDTVTVHYSGKLVNGTEFDSSYKRGEPATFPVNGVIPGWVEALKLMQPGAVWELYIPANLAYGEQGAPPQIGPNQALIFKVNLIKINSNS